MCLSRLLGGYNLSPERMPKQVYTIYKINLLPERDYSDHVKTWQLKGLTKSIRMPEGV